MIAGELGIQAELEPGDRGVFDVIVEERTIFSKHTARRFPEADEIVRLLNAGGDRSA